MRIAYLFDRPLPATETDSEQALSTIAALARRGHDVTLVVPEGGAARTAGDLCAHYRVQGDFALAFVPSPLPFWSTGRKWWHAYHAALHAASRDADVLYTRNFPALFRLPRLGRPFVYETYRPWFDQFPVLKPPFRRALTAPNCLGAVLHSRFAEGRYAALGVPAERLCVLHNGYDPARFANRPSQAALRSALGLPEGRVVAAYTGHIDATKGLDVVLGMARRTPDVHFALVGSAGDGLVERLARRVSNVQVIGWQPFDRVADYLLAADVLLQPPSSVPLKLVGNTVLPMKLFLYLAAGRPVLGPDAADVREVLRHGENALLVAPGDVEGAADALRRLADDPGLRERLGRGALASARGLTWDARAEKLERFLEARLGARRAA